MIQGYYICKICHEEFTKGRSDHEAKKDFYKHFPNQDLKNTIQVCEDCYDERIRNTNHYAKIA